MGEYRHGQPLFPKEIVLVIIAAVVMAGAVMFFGPHLLSATNSGANTVANPNPVNPVEIPKAGDTGQLPVVNETTSAPKQAEKVSDNIRIIGNGLKLEVGDASKLDRVESGTIYFSEYEVDGGTRHQAIFYLVVDRYTGVADLKNVVLEFRGTTIKNFRVIENSNSITIMATIVADENLQEISTFLEAISADYKVGIRDGNRQIQKKDLKKNQETMLGHIYASSVDQKDKLSKTKILILRVSPVSG